jgi:hypothetical protein
MSDIDRHLPELDGRIGLDLAQNPDLPATSLPWIVNELEACFVVIDGIGQKIAFVYFAHEADRRSNAKLFSKDEARRIAANVAKLPELVRKVS